MKIATEFYWEKQRKEIKVAFEGYRKKNDFSSLLQFETKNVLRLEMESPFQAVVPYVTCVGQFTSMVSWFIIHGEVILKTL